MEPDLTKEIDAALVQPTAEEFVTRAVAISARLGAIAASAKEKEIRDLIAMKVVGETDAADIFRERAAQAEIKGERDFYGSVAFGCMFRKWLDRPR